MKQIQSLLHSLIIVVLVSSCVNNSTSQEESTDIADNTVVAIPQGYSKIVFQDEFNDKGLVDAAKWGYEEGYLRNGEKQYYTKGRLENCRVENGVLYITALNDSALIDGAIRPVTSASITTKGKAEWKYCRIDVRAKLPVCLGTWPAIWMMPAESSYGRWPDSGEIDIMEHVGYEPESVHYAIHMKSNNHMKGNGFTSKVFSPTPNDFHIYSIEWHEDRLEWYLDGRKRFVINKPTESNWENWPYDQPFYLILNFAFGGGWGGQKGIDMEGMPLEYVIDYVRVFQ
ncbi:beta-glucanase (GH16 family) [Dysgonomonas hofstadii]|uniref:Beta-glucanase (GH16 family) n=1 Tax=Dysgonomonas hofstadii TaxID=637886 RepID=A0A840CJL3_9BACT|nr:glycoside hydrolase family 16 protein [Dysgonomonas hofstadii]MBB4035361.1 beta-glucanase (GH16 family) [Dysgonomonas hofstadii]